MQPLLQECDNYPWCINRESEDMNFLRLLPALLFCSASVMAADLSKIDRIIAKEPKYQSKPKYCLLVFGLDAKTKVWLVLDGDVLYVDRNGNGDLIAEDKKVSRGKAHGQVPGNFACGDIVQSDGKTLCTGLTVSGSAEEGDMSVAINLDGKHGQSAAVDANGYLQFADSPDRAPVIHFNGPRTMSVIPLADIYIKATSEKKGDKVEIISQEKTVRVFWPTFVLGGEKAELRGRLHNPFRHWLS
jgi:hypothetical protein